MSCLLGATMLPEGGEPSIANLSAIPITRQHHRADFSHAVRKCSIHPASRHPARNSTWFAD
jgi:hypothetical protein